GAGAKVADGQGGQLGRQGIADRRQPPRQHGNVEAQVAGIALLFLLVLGEQVEEQSADARLVQVGGDGAVARAQAAAAGAVGEEHQAACARRKAQVSGELDIAGCEAHRARTSSSVVWEKSSYQSPTARNGSGVAAQTTSSTSEASAAQVCAAAMGTATTS